MSSWYVSYEQPPNTLESVKIKSMGETTTLTVHRCRFIDFKPSSITALAFPPLPLPPIKGKRKTTTTDRVPKFGPLIVGHANGNIEIYEWTGSTDTVEAPQAWVVRKVRVQSLSFFAALRLCFFSLDTLRVEPIQSRLPCSHPQASRSSA
jgi:hypothetical protein